MAAGRQQDSNLELWRTRDPLSDLNDTLQGPHARRTAVLAGAPGDANLCHGLEAKAAEAVREMRIAECEAMLRAPWRITRIVFPEREPTWPIAGVTIHQALARCRRLIGQERRRAGHWTHNFHRLVTLQNAEAALVQLTGGRGDACPAGQSA